MSEHHKETVVLYHSGCPDGLGGTYAAWKKFGDSVEYIPVKHGKPVPNDLAGRKLIFIDFSYPKEIMDEIVRTAASVTVLDHHLGTRAVVESVPDHVFDEKRSGATIAWEYFHPGTPVPTLLQYIEDGDLYRFSLPHSREILAYIYISPLLPTFEKWDALAAEIDNPARREEIIQAGNLFETYHRHIIDEGVRHAELVTFENYECYLASAIGEFISDMGHALALAKPPIALVISANATGLRVSLRSDGSVDVSTIARKYGGNGHPAAAGFRITYGDRIPWTQIQDENTRD